jgi:two-component system, NarL family, response regulator DevR
MPTTENLRVFLVDDHELIRRGLRDLVGSEPDLEVVGEAGTVRQAVKDIPDATPDLVLLDLRLPDGTGADVCRELAPRLPETRFLVLTSFADRDEVLDAVGAGAAGYLLKDSPTDQCLTAIRDVARGSSLLDPSVAGRLLEGSGGRGVALDRLTPQERKVVELLAEGLTNRQIGERLGLAEKTVKNHVSGLLPKLEAANRTEAALTASRLLARR